MYKFKTKVTIVKTGNSGRSHSHNGRIRKMVALEQWSHSKKLYSFLHRSQCPFSVDVIYNRMLRSDISGSKRVGLKSEVYTV